MSTGRGQDMGNGPVWGRRGTLLARIAAAARVLTSTTSFPPAVPSLLEMLFPRRGSLQYATWGATRLGVPMFRVPPRSCRPGMGTYAGVLHSIVRSAKSPRVRSLRRSRAPARTYEGLADSQGEPRLMILTYGCCGRAVSTGRCKDD